MSRRNKKDKSPKALSSVSPSKITTTPNQPTPQLPAPIAKQKRSRLVLLAEIVGALIAIIAGIATIAAGGGYVLERWQDTVASIDFSGEVDQKKPFTIPLVIKNPSTIVSIHVPVVSCWVEVEYFKAEGDYHTLMAVDQPPRSAGLGIAPGQTRNYYCNAPDNLALHQGASSEGPLVPVKQAKHAG